MPDLMQILVDLSINAETEQAFLSIFERLGGLRIWLPLLATAYAPVRRMTLRLLRTYINFKCNIPTTNVASNVSIHAHEHNLYSNLPIQFTYHSIFYSIYI